MQRFDSVLKSQEKEKYLRLVHLVKLQIENVRRGIVGHGELVKLMLNCAAIVDRIDLERCVCILFE